MAAQVNAVAAGLLVAPVLPTKILRLAAGDVMLSSRCAALHKGAPITRSLVMAFWLMGSATTSPFQLLVSNFAEYDNEPLVTLLPVLKPPPATLRELVEARLKISSNAPNTSRAGDILDVL